jgi:NAD(P)H-hydrate epimerase
MDAIPWAEGDVPYLTTAQMVAVDRAMIDDFSIDLIQMMENAGRALAHLARLRFCGGDPRGKHVVVLAGSGGNGGGALVCARRLHNYGAHVSVYTTKEESGFSGVPAHQLKILHQMGVPVAPAPTVAAAPSTTLIIDGIIGYSLKGAPRDHAADLIRWANAQEAPILALDVPSGVDASGGTVYEPTITATATLTLALPKEGLRAPGHAHQTGELYLADISVPPELYARPPLSLPVGHLFARRDIVRLPLQGR